MEWNWRANLFLTAMFGLCIIMLVRELWRGNVLPGESEILPPTALGSTALDPFTPRPVHRAGFIPMMFLPSAQGATPIANMAPSRGMCEGYCGD